MPELPDGELAPADGALPTSTAIGAANRTFSVYVHVPFCTVRCGYCDFNTYTASDLGGGASLVAYAETARREIDLAAAVLAPLPARPVSTVFFGGGTPTALPVSDLARLIDAVRATLGLAADAEVTCEANPDSVSAQSLADLAAAGVTRMSFGMQSAVPEVLATLDRTHDPARLGDVVRWTRAAGLAVSLDLIYGTPGETLEQWQRSVQAAIDLGPDHISAYSLTIEPGTAMARRVSRGELATVDGDDQADKYELADEAFDEAGYRWYEISNWARRTQDRCRHNVAYWRSQDWWGIGPGAHSHVGGVRWWNVKHPRAYAARLADGVSPAQGREQPDSEASRLEAVLLGVRLSDGLAIDEVPNRAVLPLLVDDGLIKPPAGGRVVLTRQGRLLADKVVHMMVD